MGNRTEGLVVAEMATSQAGRPTKATAGAGFAVRHLNQAEVACRWSISPRTLERWRWTGQGPRFLKVGGRVVYRLVDIETFEGEQLRTSTVRPEARAQADAR